MALRAPKMGKTNHWKDCKNESFSVVNVYYIFSWKLKRNDLYFFDFIFLKDLFYIDENNLS